MNGKRDMRKKFVKSSRPTYKKRIRKAQQGMRFVNYNVVENPTIDYKDITNPTNPFSEYNFNTTYNTPQGLVVPTREDSKPDTVEETPVVANNPTVEPVVNKPVTKTAKSTWKSPYTNRKQWTTELINAYKKAGITNDNAIRMLLAQDALESSWGKSAQGKYNFGNLTTGSSWKGDYVTGNDKNAKGEAIKQKFRSYNSMDEYAADKIQFLKRLYDFDENDDINKFVAKLTGSNKGKRRYAEAKEYANSLRGVYNSFREGGIIKYQNPAQPIARRDATYVAPKMYAPRPYKTKEEEIIEQNRNSEMISIPAHSTIGMVDGKLQVVNTPARQITNIGAGYLSGTDPVGEFVVGNIVAGKPLMWLGRGLEYGAAKAGSQLAKNRIVGRAINNSEIKTPTQSLPNNVGWGPRQTIKGAVHDKDTMEPLRLYSPKRYDAINEGAPKAGVWFQGKLGTPRDAINTSVTNKVDKAANARDLFAKRPVRVEGDLELNKPLVTVGDVPNRAQIQKAADTMGGDGVIFNNVYDNGYGHNQVIFSYRTDLKNGRMFKKGTQPLETPERVDKGVAKAANKYPAKNLEVNLNPDRSWNMDKIHNDVDRGTKEAIEFLESDIKKETDLYNKELAKRLGYEHFTPYPNGAERARVKVTPDYETITYPNGEYAGRVGFNPDPSKDILQYNKHYNLHPTAFHENLHRGYYGMVSQDRKPLNVPIREHSNMVHDTMDFYDFKAKKLLVPKEEAIDAGTYSYLLEKGEAAANTMELGKRLGLRPGQEYPGRQALERMLKEFSESGNEHAFMPKYLNMKHPKRVWNALTGKYFVYPLIGTTLIGGMNYEKGNNE